MDFYRGELSWQGNVIGQLSSCSSQTTCRSAVPQERWQFHGHTMGSASSGVFSVSVQSQRNPTKSFASNSQPLAAAGNRNRVSAELGWLFQELDGL